MIPVLICLLAFIMITVCLYLLCLYPGKGRKELLLPFKSTYIAHRGLFNKEDAPENSMEAFVRAIDAGYAIELFCRYILPQFPSKEKIKIINDSAYEYCKSAEGYDFVFADIWHDPSDGCRAYLTLKQYEKEGCIYSYWIEDTIKYYLNP